MSDVFQDTPCGSIRRMIQSQLLRLTDKHVGTMCNVSFVFLPPPLICAMDFAPVLFFSQMVGRQGIIASGDSPRPGTVWFVIRLITDSHKRRECRRRRNVCYRSIFFLFKENHHIVCDLSRSWNRLSATTVLRMLFYFFNSSS